MKNKTNFFIDIGIFFAFLLTMEPRLTGIAIHEWFSLAVAGTVVVHLLLHWDWMINIGKKYFVKLWHSSRLNFLLDALLFISFSFVMLSGLMISESVLPALNILVGQNFVWRMIHSVSAELSMFLIALHVGLHWHWIWTMFKKILAPVRSLFKTNPELAPIPLETEDNEIERMKKNV